MWKKLNKFFIDDSLFKEDGKGGCLFYPWGYPGEAFIITRSQKLYISTWIALLAFLFVFSVAIGVYFDNVHTINFGTLIYSMTAVIVALSLIYLCTLLLLTKKLNILSRSNKEKAGDKRRDYIAFFVITINAYIGISTALFDKSLSHEFLSIFTVTTLLWALCVFLIVRKNHRTKGHFFSEKN
ncbi:MAG TPA: hypothetical protein PLO23_03450 [Alphaproteobacteria bacterium]|nr:hypothetical protein [Alphaproteobacteria bacterium]